MSKTGQREQLVPILFGLPYFFVLARRSSRGHGRRGRASGEPRRKGRVIERRMVRMSGVEQGGASGRF